MILTIQNWFKRMKLKKEYSSIQFDQYEIWLDKKYKDEVQDAIDNIITIAKLINYEVKFEFTEEKDIFENPTSKQKLEILFRNNSPSSTILETCGIIFLLREDVVTYLITREKNKRTKPGRETCTFAHHNYELKYEKFIRNLKQMPRLL